jgi:hypothetical protein
MIAESPKVDRRTRDDIAAQVRRRLARTLDNWPAQTAGGAADALIGVFAQYCGTIIERLNRAPKKNLLAFLDMIGVSPQPAQAARVPLTFHLAAQHTGHVTVPAMTQVAAAMEKGEQLPVIFETERELVVTSSKLVTLAVKDGSADTFDDHSSILETTAAKGVSMLHGLRRMDHFLYLDLGLSTPPPDVQRLHLNVELEAPVQPSFAQWLSWEVWNGAGVAATPITPLSDGTEQLTKSGEILFESLPPIPRSEVDGRQGYWLRCGVTQLLKADTNLPAIRSIGVQVEASRTGLDAESVLGNSAILDKTKDFFPFGKQPGFGDDLYVANTEVFSQAGATVRLHFTLTNPESGGTQTPIKPVIGRSVRLRWELWDGEHWITAGISDSSHPTQDQGTGFSDTTKSFTESGIVSLRVPATTAPLKLGGLENFWLRVRIVSGDYGHPATYEKGPDGTPVIVQASFAPPAISELKLDYLLRTNSPPRKILTYNDFTFADVSSHSPVRPYEPAPEQAAYFYLGFVTAKNFSNRSMSIYLGVGNPPDRKRVLDMSNSAQATLFWEYWNGSQWTKWTVIDDTDAFRRSGIIRFLAPRDFSEKREFGLTRHWLRVKVVGEDSYEPRLRIAALNTTMASQSITILSEVLGSSKGTPGQKFRTTKSPVLSGQQLEVLEPAMPSIDAQRQIREEEGDDAIRKCDPGDARGPGYWVRWHEVPNFNGSSKRDRHYVIDRERGELLFGDDVNGRVPYAASKNIVMARYRTGGGAAGNRKVHTIEQLKSSIPYIDKVTNPEPSAGGADAESLDGVIDRAPRQLRHGYRAVTAQDFEDMALLASPGVARARAVPLYDLVYDPDAESPRPGIVSLILAPVASPSTQVADRPMPTMELIRLVRDYLDQHRLTEASLVIVGPEYVAIKVEAEVTVTDVDSASDVELAVSLALSRFLHPALGRRDGAGWHFGEEPTKSDLFALIEDVPGVDHVRELKVSRMEDRPGAYETGYFLICGAEPVVTATLDN